MRARPLVLGLLAASATPMALGAQDPRLERRLDPQARALVAPLIDSAQAERLPTELLVDRALEGATKRAPATAIAAAVRRLVGDLRRAGAALGPGAPAAELAAAADALRAGVAPEAVQGLRSELAGRSLTVPLAVLADLAARGVPPDTAASLIHALARAGSDTELLAFQHGVERDIALGAPPLAAAMVRGVASLQPESARRKP